MISSDERSFESHNHSHTDAVYQAQQFPRTPLPTSILINKHFYPPLGSCNNNSSSRYFVPSAYLIWLGQNHLFYFLQHFNVQPKLYLLASYASNITTTYSLLVHLPSQSSPPVNTSSLPQEQNRNLSPATVNANDVSLSLHPISQQQHIHS